MRRKSKIISTLSFPVPPRLRRTGRGIYFSLSLSLGLSLFIFFLFSLPTTRAQPSIPELFEAETAEKTVDEAAKKAASCLAGWRQFLSAGVGFEDFSDYWRDFALYPSHYADVRNVENQLNKARYAVMSAFLRCDLNKLKSVTNSYYKLEAELYFLRHFVETGGGFLRILSEGGDSRQFEDEMIEYMILKKASDDPEQDRALFSGYYEEFKSKYNERAKEYAGLGDDPLLKGLKEKIEELIDTFKGFQEFGEELASLGQEAIVEPAQAVSKAAVDTFQNPASALRAAAGAVLSKFDACVTTSDNRYCALGEDHEGGARDQDLLDIIPLAKDLSRIYEQGAPTFGEVNFALSKQELKKTEDLDEAEMRARYELLYGQLSGDGASAVIRRLDDLILVLGAGRQANPNAKNPEHRISVPGTLPPLKAVAECAEEVQERVCK